MMKLSERLQALADEIRLDETMADIGTDHGFLPLYLWEQQISPKVVMTDISPGSLAKAEQNCKKSFPGTTFDLRLGSGLDVLNEGEVDVVVIAGMGGILMSEILLQNPRKSRSIKRFILQPRNKVGYLRKQLTENNFIIDKESLVREGKYICEIIVVSPDNNVIDLEKTKNNFNEKSDEEILFLYPDSLVTRDNPLTKEYLQRHLDKAKFIYTKNNNEQNRKIVDRLGYLIKELNKHE